MPLGMNLNLDDDELEDIRYVSVILVVFLVLPCFAGVTKISRQLTGYKTPYSKETDGYDMQTRSTHHRNEGLMEKLLVNGYGRSFGRWWMRVKRGLLSV